MKVVCKINYLSDDYTTKSRSIEGKFGYTEGEYRPKLTEGKIYDVVGINIETHGYVIKDDNGHEIVFPNCDFYTLGEYRNNKIDQIV